MADACASAANAIIYLEAFSGYSSERSLLSAGAAATAAAAAVGLSEP